MSTTKTTETTETETALVATLPQAVNLANLPRGAAWLLAEASLLETEAAKYVQYSPPCGALTEAARQLRSAVGHVLAGKWEKVTA
jgi:hypothetical protein